MPIHCDWTALVTEAIASLSPNEREESVIYIEQRVIPIGEMLPWSGLQQSFDEPVVIAFADMEPAMNWTHRGRYMVLGAGGGVRRKVDVDRPPFLTEVSPYLRMIHRGSRAPAWAVVTSAIEQ